MGKLIVRVIRALAEIFGRKKAIQKPEDKPQQQIAEDKKPEEAERESDAVPKPIAVEPEDEYVGYFGISKVADEYLQLVQLKTQAASVGEVVADALRFYVDIVNKFEPGDQLLLKKSSDGDGYILLKFKPLERIHKKVES